MKECSLPRKTDASNPADWIAIAEAYFTNRCPGFDLEDSDWPTLRQEIEAVSKLLDAVKAWLVENR
jgi:hypothetical protein